MSRPSSSPRRVSSSAIRCESESAPIKRELLFMLCARRCRFCRSPPLSSFKEIGKSRRKVRANVRTLSGPKTAASSARAAFGGGVGGMPPTRQRNLFAAQNKFEAANTHATARHGSIVLVCERHQQDNSPHTCVGRSRCNAN